MYGLLIIALTIALQLFGGGVHGRPATTTDVSVDITGISFTTESIRNSPTASFSDNWAVTLNASGVQLTTYGDGGGFGGSNTLCRASMGFSTLSGDYESEAAANVLGCNASGGCVSGTPDAACNAANSIGSLTGKSYGLLALSGDSVVVARCGTASDNSCYDIQDFYTSDDAMATLVATGVSFVQADFTGRGPFAFAAIQFGAGYTGVPSEVGGGGFTYWMATEIQNTTWDVQSPGEIHLLRVHRDSLAIAAGYRFFAGLDGSTPTWSADVDDRTAVLTNESGFMRLSVIYLSTPRRYVLAVQTVDRHAADGAMVAFYDAEQPWGSWGLIDEIDPFSDGLNTGTKTVYYGFSQKWSSWPNFVMVYTGPGGDQYGTIEGTFTTN